MVRGGETVERGAGELETTGGGLETVQNSTAAPPLVTRSESRIKQKYGISNYLGSGDVLM